jgi:hypothetical protein
MLLRREYVQTVNGLMQPGRTAADKKTGRLDGEKQPYRVHADVSIGPVGIAGAKQAAE